MAGGSGGGDLVGSCAVVDEVHMVNMLVARCGGLMGAGCLVLACKVQ